LVLLKIIGVWYSEKLGGKGPVSLSGTLYHNLPGIGEVSVKLGEKPWELYEIMQQQGEIQRLSNLIHIGALQEAFPGMRHTRWDYTVAILYFIKKFSEKNVEGLSSNKTVQGIEISGRDILQIYALITNIGHLPGTFSVEKGVARFLTENEEWRGRFEKEVKGVIKIIDQDKKRELPRIDYMSVNKYLVLLKLKSWMESAKGRNCTLRLATELACDLLFGENKREKLYDYFVQAKKLAYLSLDALFVNLPIKVDFVEIMRGYPENWEVIKRFIDNYVCIIYRVLYHSEKASPIIGNWARATYQALAGAPNPMETISEWPKCSTVEDLGISPTPIFQRDGLARIRVPFENAFASLGFGDIEDNVEELELKLSDAMQDSECVVLYIPNLWHPISDKSTEFQMDVLAKDTNIENRVLLLASLILNMGIKFNGSFCLGTCIRQLFENLMCEISIASQVVIRLAEDEFFKEDYYPTVNPDNKIGLCKSGDALKYKKEKFWQPRDLEASKDKREEIEALKCVLDKVVKDGKKKYYKRYSQYYVDVPGNIVLEDEQRKSLCEFDGAVLRILARGKDVKSVHLFLLEAKARKRRGNVRGELEKKINAMKLQVGEVVDIYAVRRKSAYAYIRLI